MYTYLMYITKLNKIKKKHKIQKIQINIELGLMKSK